MKVQYTDINSDSFNLIWAGIIESEYRYWTRQISPDENSKTKIWDMDSISLVTVNF